MQFIEFREPPFPATWTGQYAKLLTLFPNLFKEYIAQILYFFYLRHLPSEGIVHEGQKSAFSHFFLVLPIVNSVDDQA